jgi:thioredoxin-like negative regulator of GroEL
VSEFERRVLGSPGRIVVLFGSPRVNPACYSTYLALERAALLTPGALVGVVKSRVLALQYDVLHLPTTLVFVAGQEVRRLVGPQLDAVLLGILRGC